MARIAVQQAASTKSTMVAPQSNKMRFRPRLPSKSNVANAASGAQAPGLLVRFSINMPRQIRARISRNRKPSRLVASDSSDFANHEVVRSPSSGKMAMGPWLGPFETCDDAPYTHIYFVDMEGIAYPALASEPESLQEAPKRPATPSLEDVAVGTVRRAHSAEVRQAHWKVSTLKNWPTRRTARSAARMNKVHQPRHNY